MKKNEYEITGRGHSVHEAIGNALDEFSDGNASLFYEYECLKITGNRGDFHSIPEVIVTLKVCVWEESSEKGDPCGDDVERDDFKDIIVYQVSAAQAHRQKEKPISLLVKATGLVRTEGWKNLRLERQRRKCVPEDGYIEFYFVGDKPTGNGNEADVITEVSAFCEWKGFEYFEDQIEGIEIIAEDNKIQVPKKDFGKEPSDQI